MVHDLQQIIKQHITCYNVGGVHVGRLSDAESAGAEVVTVKPAHTSQVCSGCGVMFVYIAVLIAASRLTAT
jgi:hypothetical protein